MSQLLSKEQGERVHNVVGNTQYNAVAKAFNTEPLSPEQQQALRAILECGLPHVAQPYLAIAKQISATQAQVLAQISYWQEDGLVKRFGLVVKHRKLGFKANAMVVWNIADDKVNEVAALLSSCPEVSLCYRRPRRLPDWPYNLFCMIHGTDRAIVIAQITAMTQQFGLEDVAKDILFSFKAYKQQGARYGKKGDANG
ncbi:hypothetical protein [Colwellia sp. M166]|uniref:siroheme decarboxylase subunit beta n=1 Tax=Colwellia sp. M166 TaxID=2583805 RepID=UPI00211E86B9|nr:hypothetical protein [Colwellia sp. M166]|tara:strand:+ start:9193 stop:9786 length:594 start_codon:yes stop_codon:yes gene_type:complete